MRKHPSPAGSGGSPPPTLAKPGTLSLEVFTAKSSVICGTQYTKSEDGERSMGK